MTQTPVDPIDSRSMARQLVRGAELEIQHDRGVIYVYAHDGMPLLKITGLPRPIPELADSHPHVRHLILEVRDQTAVCYSHPAQNAVPPDVPTVELSLDEFRTAREVYK